MKKEKKDAEGLAPVGELAETMVNNLFKLVPQEKKVSEASAAASKTDDSATPDNKAPEAAIVDPSQVAIEEEQFIGSLGLVSSLMIQATLPHSKPKGEKFVRKNGNFTLTVSSNGDGGLPYGVIPRLILLWLTSEAYLTRSRLINLGPSLSAFMAEVGLTPHGAARAAKTEEQKLTKKKASKKDQGNMTTFRRQMTSLFTSSISGVYADNKKTSIKNVLIVDDAELWWEPQKSGEKSETPTWKSDVLLSERFYNVLVHNPVPVDMAALKALKRSPLALDIYFWLTYRMSYLKKSIRLTWDMLQLQFGADYPLTARGKLDFKRNFLKRLKSVQKIYNQAKVAVVKEGLVLEPSPTHVPKRPFKRPPIQHKPPLLPAPGKPSQQAILPLPVNDDDTNQPFALRTSTFEKARLILPGADIYELEAQWREWIIQKDERPRNPDKAFLGFIAFKARQRRGA